MSKRIYFLFILILIMLHISIFVSTKFIDWPELLMYPWLLHHNFALYTDILIPYQPFVLILLKTLYLFLGFSVANLKIIHLTLMLAVDGSLFLLLHKTTKSYPEVIIGLLFYALMPFSSIQFSNATRYHTLDQVTRGSSFRKSFHILIISGP